MENDQNYGWGPPHPLQPNPKFPCTIEKIRQILVHTPRIPTNILSPDGCIIQSKLFLPYHNKNQGIFILRDTRLELWIYFLVTLELYRLSIMVFLRAQRENLRFLNQKLVKIV